jgi:hypothetical protein
MQQLIKKVLDQYFPPNYLSKHEQHTVVWDAIHHHFLFALHVISTIWMQINQGSLSIDRTTKAHSYSY